MCIRDSPRLISMENFRRPNFVLVADILYWLAMRYDPNADISDSIEEEKDRVEFIKSVCQLFAAKARTKLNAKKLYSADGYAVQEILKVATLLYKAYSATGKDEEEKAEFSLPSKFGNLKATRQLATEITEKGAKLYDLLSKENDLRQHREKALQFLDSISRNLESNSEQQYIEKCVKELIEQQAEQINEMQKYVANLERDEKTLDEKIKRRAMELDRAEKRLKTLTNVRPAYMDEYERLENELDKIYGIYLEKFRNLEYLEHQLDLYNQEEQEKLSEAQKALKAMQKKIKDEELRMLRGEQEIDESVLDAQLLREDGLNSRGASRSGNNSMQTTSTGFNRTQGKDMMKTGGGGRGQVVGSLREPIEDEDEEGDGGGDEDGDEDGNLIAEDEEEGSGEDQDQQSDDDNNFQAKHQKQGGQFVVHRRMIDNCFNEWLVKMMILHILSFLQV
eukprot:TRINITY_DN5295_c0_g1_i8.p1 TRINITY_DN5295_c0_g1~~TRINITY_DN5295_c0_g1_i8.p1  ORF type:complete len:450 (+),score=104.33 TRINITY_DN5295_c0_g1_i8:65-1414(+)